MRQIVSLLACSLALLACTHNQNFKDVPVKQNWILQYLEGYDDFYNNIKLADGYEWAEQQAISDNRLSALYYPTKNLVIGQFFSGCNGASNIPSEDGINNWQMTVTQVGCSRLVRRNDGSLHEHVHGSLDVADRVFSKVSSRISKQSVDWDKGLLLWYSVDDRLLAKFKLEAAE